MSLKKVLVTGSSRGIGNSILEIFSSKEFIPIGTATSNIGVEKIKQKLLLLQKMLLPQVDIC